MWSRPDSSLGDRSMSESEKNKRREVVDLCDDSDETDDGVLVSSCPPSKRSKTEGTTMAPNESISNSRTLPRVLLLQQDDGTNTLPATFTEGFFHALSKISCSISTTSSCASNCKSQQAPIMYQPFFHLVHLQQQDRWSCGYRNTQMLLASFLSCSYLSGTHSYYKNRQFDPSVAEIPSLTALQRILEESWKAGYDPDSARHYQGTIVGKHEYIGAMEVLSLLTYLGIDATVVQFARTPESRQELGNFCKSYFETRPLCPFCAGAESYDTVKSCLDKSTTRASAPMTTSCSCPVFPLMLQWEGHSVTIVGFSTENYEQELLLLNPQKKGSTMLNDLIKRGDASRMRVRLEDIQRQDTQIVAISLTSLSDEEQMNRKRVPAVVLAARESIIRSL